MAFLYSVTAFFASALLFSIQPMIGKEALPFLGGTPAVWTACLVFFQASLLGGYALAHGLAASPRRLVSLSGLLGVALFLGLGLMNRPVTRLASGGLALAETRQPAVALLGLLAGSAIPLVALSAVSPLLQAWFATTRHPRAHDPYFLYAASNTGSLLALVAYPFAIEPAWGLADQERGWRVGFLITSILILASAVAARITRLPTAEIEPGTTPGRQTLSALARRLLLILIPSLWLPALTTYLTTDLASIPLLWTLPLALYLLGFIVAFARRGDVVVRAATWALPYAAAAWALVMSAGFTHLVWIPLHLFVFLAGTLGCVGALVRERPPARQATAFYLTLAAGGLMASLFAALVAPVILNRVVEYPAAVILGCAVSPRGIIRARSRGDLITGVLPAVVVFGLTAALATNQAGLAESGWGVVGVMLAAGIGFHSCATSRRRPIRFALVLAALLGASGLTQGPSGRLLHIERGFFGVVRVTEDPHASLRRLFLGSTLHGQQSLDPARSAIPLTYFTRTGPIGRLMNALGSRIHRPGANVAVVGLGAGTLAAYGLAGERWRFYEIDPIVARIAVDPGYFTYLSDCQASSEIILGDARLKIAAALDHSYSLIVLDAFSSDATPVHLLTREAIRGYRSKLAPGGILAFNLTNRYLDLDTIMARQAQDAGLAYRACYEIEVSSAEKQEGKSPSIWGIMAETEADLGPLAVDGRWLKGAPRTGARAWTDDFSDLASYLILTPIGRQARVPTPPGKSKYSTKKTL